MNLAQGLAARQAQSMVLQQSMTLLRLSASEMTEVLAEAAQTNPYLLVRRPKRRFLVGFTSTDVLEATSADRATSLVAHAGQELAGLIAHGGPLAGLVVSFMEELDPSGWMRGDLAKIGRRLGIDETLVDTALKLVQRRISPTGLFARDLRECLRLQLEEQGPIDSDMEAVLHHLPILESAGPARLAEQAGLDPETVRHCLAQLRQLDPKPGARFDSDPALTREPDARVTHDNGCWTVRFNRETEPSVDIAKIPKSGGNPALAEARDQARRLKWALDLRHSATRRVIHDLVSRQRRFLDSGIADLRPLTMRDLANSTGFHTSTVSRVLNGFLIETPHGMFEARTLCPGSASKLGGTHSKAQVMARLRALIGSENPADPLSDVRLTAMLALDGVAISRRVAAKYRRESGFPNAAVRRQRP